MRLLLVEDNQFLAGNIGDYLELKGISVDYASNGKQCLSLVQQNDYDVISLDIMMPGQDGFEVCKELREELHIQTPVIFLTAKMELEDKMLGFELGGDDYLTKPFELDELLCRVKALTSRGVRTDIGLTTYGEISLDVGAYKVFRNDTEIKLHKIQFEILKTLIRKAPNIVSKSDLEYEIWGDDLPDSDALRSHIYRIRSLLDKPFDFPYLKTVHGKGFTLAEVSQKNA